MRRALLLVLAGIAAVHLGVLGTPLLYDDGHAVAMNRAIQDLGNLPAFFVDPGLFSAQAGRMYRPLVLTTLALEHAAGGGAAWAFKLGNLCWHLVAAALLAAVAPALLERAGLTRGRAARAGLLAAVLFGLHPLQVESLALVSARSIVLAAVGLLLALHCWYRTDWGRWVRAGGVAAGTALACLSRETGVLVPPIVALGEWLLPAAGPASGSRSRVRALTPLLASLPVAAGYLAARRFLFALPTVPLHILHHGGDPMAGGSRSALLQLVEMTQVLPRAFLLWLYPGPLSVDHPTYFGLDPASPRVLAGAILPWLAALLAWLGRRRRPLFAFAFGASLLAAVPWILVPLNVPFAEHRLYWFVLFASLPAAGLLLRLRPRRLRVVLAGGVVLGLAARSAVRAGDWRSGARLWRSALAVNPQSFRAYSGLGEAALACGDTAAAVRWLEHGRAIYDRYGPLRSNLLEARLRHLETHREAHAALRLHRLAEDYVEERWKDPFARLLMARACRGRWFATHDPGDLRAGAAWALSCLAMVTPKRLVYRTAALVLAEGGLFDEALTLLEAAPLRITPDAALEALAGTLLVRAGRYGAAEAKLRRLARAAPFDPAVLEFALRLAAARGQGARFARLAELARRFGVDVDRLAAPAPPNPGR